MTTSVIAVSTDKQNTPVRTERVYVGIDLGYREHVVAATPLQAFNPQRQPDGWKRVKTLKFGSDAAGYQRLQRYLERCSADPADFLVLLASRADGRLLRPEPDSLLAWEGLSHPAGR